ncbi:ribonuclease R [Alkalitalea saponilacus]|uniref:Ribonuclease R n=1 Tax=Alkalitalea saponilacus TaxID=889453 RepID=A0A1T5FQ38_9BACT|nr:ribonuclease R [Alkalitalea saponilacus]ASB49463.1 ribonuclease R [Alkalitalea saponilacus]SKB98298.1 ribonuclease R [Alkalitalea saponilacus]
MPKKEKKRLKRSEIKALIQEIFFNNPKKTFNYKQIATMIGVQKKSSKQLIEVLLFELQETGFLSSVAAGRFKLLSRGSHLTGIVDMTASGAAYIVPEDGGQDIFVSQSNLKHALNGDQVRILQYARRKGHQPEGEVIEILKRGRDLFVGTLEVSSKFAFLVADSRVINRDIFIPLEQLRGAKNGQKAVVRIVEWPEKAKNPVGEIVDVLGDTGNNNAEMHAILAEFNLPYTYPQKVIDAAEKIPDKIPSEEIKKRRDFREVPTFTIDPADAKDFDDALSLQKTPDGFWEIGVHIADVTHYVQPDTLIDEEGYNRATSVYLVDRVVPMLPERLSNFLCSLRPNEDKLCFSVVFKMDDSGQIHDSWVGRTVINSDRRFSYEEAQEVIESGQGDFADEIKTMNQIALKLREKRYKKGAISFERIEVKFDIDENGKPLGVFFKESKDANKLIEEFMLAANKRVAELIGKNELDPGKRKDAKTFVYRIHDVPDPDKFENFSRFVRKFGLEANPEGKESVSQALNRLLKQVQGKAEQNIVETLAVRTMAKAIYSTHNIGHYGLAFKHYSHFTSPIRRYPDMMVHRLLQRYLDGGKSVDTDKYEEMCEHSSDMEQRAANAERASIKYKQVEFLKAHEGEVFAGVISGVTEWGLYVELIDNKCEGMIPIRDLDDDFYRFDEENYCLIGKKSRKVYQLGDKLNIQVARANLEKRQLDFVLANEEQIN